MHYLDVDIAKKISKIGLGTWQFGSEEWGYGEPYAERMAYAIVRRALELGVTLFDTAEIYGFGRSERILGRALGGPSERTGSRSSSRRRCSRSCLVPWRLSTAP